VIGELKSAEKDRIRLTNCEVTELEKNPMPTVQAVDLAKAYAKNEWDANKKFGTRYSEKELFLEGIVKNTKEGEYGTLVFLEGSGKIAVRVQVEKGEAKGVKAGDHLRFKSLCRGYWKDQGAVLLFGRILKDK
jgi:uncharacterized cupin superfamily protein